MITRFLSRPGIPPAAAGLGILLHAAAARLLFTADETRVYLLGHPLNWVCLLRERFGLPCPTCGMTRSVVLTLHGHLARAWHIAPGGPALTLAVLAVAIGLLAYAAVQFQSAGRREWLERRIRLGFETGALACAGLSIVMWLAGWAAQFSAALHAAH